MGDVLEVAAGLLEFVGHSDVRPAFLDDVSADGFAGVEAGFEDAGDGEESVRDGGEEFRGDDVDAGVDELGEDGFFAECGDGAVREFDAAEGDLVVVGAEGHGGGIGAFLVVGEEVLDGKIGDEVAVHDEDGMGGDLGEE